MAYQGLKNKTPFAAELALLADEAGREVLLVLVKATYRIIAATAERTVRHLIQPTAQAKFSAQQDYLDLAEEQRPVNLAGEYYGEPGKTSLKYAPEASFAKPGTDIALIGHAHVPTEHPAVTQLDVTLSVGAVSKTVRVFGDRVWQRKPLLSWRISPPQAFTTLPLVYERAFGGVDDTPDDDRDKAYEPRNPVGTGLIATKSRLAEVPLPNLEDPRELIQRVKDRPVPAGFGFICPDWEPRKSRAGTYDDAWQTARMPSLPTNFERRFLNAAHPDLQTKGYLQGNETVDIINASPQGRLTFSLPGCNPIMAVKMLNEPPTALETRLDSLVINTDDHTVQLLWCGSVEIHDRLYELENIETMLSHDAEQQRVSSG
ncbi:MAG: DUF2169 domain-containing protein [Gammaproteobacteria bacterium]|nr:DUF2169 domain-containing protein [Gammaproteobacteria bacterium]